MDSYLSSALVLLVLLIPLVPYLIRMKRREAAAIAAAENAQLSSDGPRAQHPHIDVLKCIGCGTCVDACPEGDVLAVVAGRAAIVNGHKCIGHGLCADACPVGAIQIVMARPSIGADMPQLTEEYETNLDNLFIAGELGGLALIKNAVNQGRECIDIIKQRLNGTQHASGLYDVCIVGAGPAGISASLRAIENKMSYITLEQDQVGGTVAKYPRQKLVMTSPVEFPIYGKFSKLEISKESLLELWTKIFQRADLKVHTGEKVEEIKKEPDATFRVRTGAAEYRACAIVLAIGRRGTPRKLGIKGEEAPKVMYSLIEAEAYTNMNILIVGGGDSAVEAALGLAHQKGNRVTLSYRKETFTRLKERNAQRIQQAIQSRKISVFFNSLPIEIREKSVVMEIHGATQEIPNDYVWIFAGGTPPNDFLKKVGIATGAHDLTADALQEAERAGLTKERPRADRDDLGISNL